MPEANPQRIANLFLEQCPHIIQLGPNVERERGIAVHDLLRENHFDVVGETAGPYNLHLGLEDERLVFDIRDKNDTPLRRVAVPVRGFRGIIKDYFLICDSYFKAREVANPSQIEAVDVGRRGLHNEGSELLREVLDGKIGLDLDTARRLFTLICVLHIR